MSAQPNADTQASSKATLESERLTALGKALDEVHKLVIEQLLDPVFNGLLKGRTNENAARAYYVGMEPALQETVQKIMNELKATPLTDDEIADAEDDFKRRAGEKLKNVPVMLTTREQKIHGRAILDVRGRVIEEIVDPLFNALLGRHTGANAAIAKAYYNRVEFDLDLAVWEHAGTLKTTPLTSLEIERAAHVFFNID